MTWLAIVLAANVLVGAQYYLRIIAAMYLEPQKVMPFEEQRSTWLMTATYLCFAATLALGAAPEPLIKLLAR